MLQECARTLFLVFCLIAVVMCVFVLFTSTTAAQSFVSLADYDQSKLAGLYSGGGSGDLAIFLGRVFTFAVSIGAMLAILRLAWAGYLYMVSDLWMDKGRGIRVFQDAILGLLLLLAVWVILHQINPDILSLNIGDSSEPPAGSGSVSVFSSSPTSAGTGFERSPEYNPGSVTSPSGVGSGYAQYAITATPSVATGSGTFSPQSCSVIRGSGWVAVDGRFCGGNMPQGYSCCAYDPSASSPSPPATTPSEAPIEYVSPNNIPAGLWCYQAEIDLYRCTTGQTRCAQLATADTGRFSACAQYPLSNTITAPSQSQSVPPPSASAQTQTQWCYDISNSSTCYATEQECLDGRRFYQFGSCTTVTR